MRPAGCFLGRFQQSEGMRSVEKGKTSEEKQGTFADAELIDN